MIDIHLGNITKQEERFSLLEGAVEEFQSFLLQGRLMDYLQI